MMMMSTPRRIQAVTTDCTSVKDGVWVYIILLHMRQCPYCVQLYPTWSQLQKVVQRDAALRNVVHFDDIEREQRAGNNMLEALRRYGVDKLPTHLSFPTIMKVVIRCREGSLMRSVRTFEGERTLPNLLRFCSD